MCKRLGTLVCLLEGTLAIKVRRVPVAATRYQKFADVGEANPSRHRQRRVAAMVLSNVDGRPFLDQHSNKICSIKKLVAAIAKEMQCRVVP